MRWEVFLFLFLAAGAALGVEDDSDEHGTYAGRSGTNCKCGWANKDSGRIVGGKETRVNEYPFPAVMAKVYNGMVSPYCGASILNERYLITAAHCVHGIVFRITVIVGEHNLADHRETNHTAYYPVTVIIHEGYHPKMITNDIALLKTDRPIAFSQFVGPICLPVSRTPPPGAYATVMGWGLTSDKGKPSSSLLKTRLQITKLAECTKYYPGNMIGVLYPTQFCTFGDGTDSCQGDSGGPVTYVDPETNRYTLIGLVSYGKGCADRYPGVNTDVHAFLPWIKSKMDVGELCHKV